MLTPTQKEIVWRKRVKTQDSVVNCDTHLKHKCLRKHLYRKEKIKYVSLNVVSAHAYRSVHTMQAPITVLTPKGKNIPNISNLIPQSKLTDQSL